MVVNYKKFFSLQDWSLVIIIAIFIISALLLCLFFLFPFGTMLLNVFSNISQFFTNFEFIFSSPIIFNAFYFSIIEAILSTLLCIAIGIPGAYIFSHYSFPGDKMVKSLITVPFLLPPIVVVIGLITVFGETGLINTLFHGTFISHLIHIDGFQGIILAHVYYNTPVIIRVVSVAWDQLDKDPLYVAETLGAPRFTRIFRLELPQLRFAIASASIIVFLYCFTSFAIILSFGSDRYRTIEVVIYDIAALLPYLDYTLASTLSLLQLLFLGVLIVLYYRISHREFSQKKIGNNERQSLHITNYPIIICIIALLFFSLLPMMTIFYYSFFNFSGALTLDNYVSLLSNQYNALIETSFLSLILNTLIIAILTVFLSLLISLGILIGIRYLHLYSWDLSAQTSRILNSFEFMLMLPLASSGILVSLGLFLLYQYTPLYSNLKIVVLIMAHTIAALPIVSRILISSFTQLNPDLRNVSFTLGSNRWKTFMKIELPLIKRPILIASLFAFAISLGEFGSTFLINPSSQTTLSIAIYRLLGTRFLGLPLAMASVLMIICVSSFWIIEYAGGSSF